MKVYLQIHPIKMLIILIPLCLMVIFMDEFVAADVIVVVVASVVMAVCISVTFVGFGLYSISNPLLVLLESDWK